MTTRHFLFFVFSLCVLSLRAAIEPGRTYRISPVSAPTQVFFPQNAQLDVSSPVPLWIRTDVPAEVWTVAQSGLFFTFKNLYTGYHLATTAATVGATTKQNASASSARWKLETVDEQAGIYRLLPNTGTACLDAKDAANGTLPTLAKRDEGSQSQLWQFTPAEASAAFTADVQRTMIDSYLTRFLQRLNSRRSTFNRGGWGESEQLEVLLDAYEATHDEQYMTSAVAVYNYLLQNVGNNWLTLVYTDNYKWYGHDFNDDVMWQIIATARMGWLTGDNKYTRVAKQNFDAIWDRAYIPFCGLMRWAEQTGEPYGTNSCIAGPTEVAACYLGMSGAGEEYFEKARDLYAAQRYSLANMTTGQVFDACVWDPATQKVTSRNNWASTYNQGTFLGAATLLYRHYGDEQYLADAKKVMDYTLKNLCDRHGIVNACQVNDGDLCGFKGILMRYVHRLVVDCEQPQYREWLQKNALHAFNNRSPRGVTTSAWLTKSTDEVATNAFSCSTAAAAAAAAIPDTDTGIRSLSMPPSRPVGKSHDYGKASAPFSATLYNLQGQPVTCINHGLSLLRKSDGTFSKVWVK